MFTLLHECLFTVTLFSCFYIKAKLESKLYSLQKQLHALHQSMRTIWSADHQTSNSANQHLALPLNQRLSGQLTKCGNSLQECCQDLLLLSILTPAAPWVSWKSSHVNNAQNKTLPFIFVLLCFPFPPPLFPFLCSKCF